MMNTFKRNPTEKLGTPFLNFYSLSLACQTCKGLYNYDYKRNLTMGGSHLQQTRCQKICYQRVQGLLAQATLKEQ